MWDALGYLTREQIEFICRECGISEEKFFNTGDFYKDVYEPLSDAEILEILEDPSSERCKTVTELVTLFGDAIQAFYTAATRQEEDEDDEEDVKTGEIETDFQVNLYRAKEKGNPDAAFECAWDYFAGNGVKRNYHKALPLFKMAAKSGKHDIAYFYIGTCYQMGYGTEVSYSKALWYYHKGVKNSGNMYCYNQLGDMYEKGLGVQQNSRTALKYYLKAAERGLAISYENAGSIYERGELGLPDLDKAMKYYQMAADHGSREAAAWLAHTEELIGKWKRGDFSERT